MTDQEHIEQEDDWVSKTQHKKQCEELQKLGDRLIKLQAHELEQMHLPEKLAAAVAEARRLNARSGLKRQRQYIGKIMREIDSDSVRTQLEYIRHKNDASNAGFKKTENWRDRLLSDDHDALTDILNQYPDIDRQHLNQLVRQAKKEASQDKPPAAARKLFKYIRPFIDDAPQ